MSILVTGGSGYIGSHICVELLNKGYDLVVVDNFSNSKPQCNKRIKELTGKEFKFYQLNVLDHDQLETVFIENEIEAVIHLAGLKAVAESVADPIRYYHNNVSGTLVLCEIMKKYNVKKMVFSSSATVYDVDNVSPIMEDASLRASNPYGWTKLMNEQILQDIYNSDNSWSISLLRYFNPIGAHESGMIGEDPNDLPNNLMPHITKVALEKRDKLAIFGDDYDTYDGTGVRDYLHVVDLAEGHLSALEKVLTTTTIDTYNLGTGIGYSVLDVVKTFEKTTNTKIAYEIKSRRAGDIAKYFANPNKAYQELGWKAEKNLEDMCRDAYRWQKMNPEGYE